ncbi:MAG: FecR family protein [Myxococcota bacterium]
MRHRSIGFFARVFRLMVVALFVTPGAAAAQTENAGRVLSVRGTATVRPDGNLDKAPVPIVRGQHLPQGAAIRTGKDSAVRLLMADKSILAVGPSSYLTVARYRIEPKTKKRSVGLHLFVGRLWAKVTKAFSGGAERNYEVYTPNAVAGIRGTELVVDVDIQGNSQVTCVEGSIEVGSLIDEIPSQMIGALERTNITRQGEMRQQAITAGEAKQLTQSVGGGTAMNPAKSAERVQQAQQQQSQTPGDKPPTEKQRQQKEQQKRDGPNSRDQQPLERNDAPPLDLEPSSGRTRIRGRIEVKELP